MNRNTGVARRRVSVARTKSPERGTPGEHQIVLPPAEPLRELPPTHPALNYLRGRGFDPAAIAEGWDVYYCAGNSEVQPFFPDPRLVVPLFSVELVAPGKKVAQLAGWQARAIEEDRTGKLPNFLFCRGMQRNRCLYNMPAAMNADGPLFLVKGVTDTWRLSTYVVGLLGWTLSVTQGHYITRDFRHRPIVVFLDRDHEREAQRLAREIRLVREMRNDPTPVVVGQVPDHRADLADCTASEALGAACSALRQFNDDRLMGIFRGLAPLVTQDRPAQWDVPGLSD